MRIHVNQAYIEHIFTNKGLKNKMNKKTAKMAKTTFLPVSPEIIIVNGWLNTIFSIVGRYVGLPCSGDGDGGGKYA